MLDVGHVSQAFPLGRPGTSVNAVTIAIDRFGVETTLSRRNGAIAKMFATLEHGRRKFPRAGIVISSENRGWNGLAAELRSHPQGHLPSFTSDQMEITLTLTGDGNGVVQRRGNGTRQETPVRPGQLWLCPIGVFEESVFISQPIEQVAHVYLPAALFRRFSADSRGSAMRPGSVGYIAGLDDPLLQQMVLAVVAELQQETAGGRLLLDALSLSMVARLATAYGDLPIGVSDVQKGAIDHARLKRVLDFIEDHIETDFLIEDLAEIACLSRFHFSRSFKKSMGVPPHRYIAERRFAHAVDLLTHTNRSLSDIAFACCFSSDANFIRAFSRAAGLTPARFRARLDRIAH